MEIRAGVLTVSDKGYAGQRDDRSGPVLAQGLAELDVTVVERAIVPDDPGQITSQLIAWADQGLDLIVSTGGTGATPRDNTPEATLAAIERQMPGIAELLRSEGYKKTPLAVLSRGVAGLRGRCLIINLAGQHQGRARGFGNAGADPGSRRADGSGHRHRTSSP